MFILYSLVVLAALRFRWSASMLTGLLVQVVLFSEPVTARIGALGPPIYIGSTGVVSRPSSRMCRSR